MTGWMMLPRDKGDYETVEQLRGANRSSIVPLVPSLLEWLQDINWPIARPIAELLREYPDELAAPVRAVLQGDDDIWKYWIISELLVDGPSQLCDAVSKDLIRIANNPRPGEVDEEVHLVARDVVVATT